MTGERPTATHRDVDYDPFETNDDPFPTYKLLRDLSPVYQSSAHGFWALSRFEDVQWASREWETFSSVPGVDLDRMGEFFQPGNMVDSDPPKHDRLRNAVRRDFSPKMIRRFEGMVRRRVRSLIAAFVERGEADLVREFARPLPAHVVCDLLGFPEEDHVQLDRWFTSMIERVPGQVELPEIAWEANRQMRKYVADALSERLASPRDDLLSTLARLTQEGVLEPEEAGTIPVLLFFAGIQTTSALVATSLRELERHPEQRARLVADHSLITKAIDELLRYDPPIHWFARGAIRDVELHGELIPAGARILLMWGSANRDERRWEEPDRLDIMREPKRHLAFGDGIHHCLGAPLAHLESRIALEELLPLIPDYEVSGPVVRLYTPGERALAHLPVAFAPRPSSALAS